MNRIELEDRILVAVESQVLIPENVAYVAEQALQIVRTRTDLRDPALDRARLEAIADELANLMCLATTVGRLDPHAQVLRELLVDCGGRDVLKILLGGQRLRVLSDRERGFAVEGELCWLLGAGAAPGPGGCCGSVVAGTRFVLVEGQRFRLPWTWAA